MNLNTLLRHDTLDQPQGASPRLAASKNLQPDASAFRLMIDYVADRIAHDPASDVIDHIT